MTATSPVAAAATARRAGAQRSSKSLKKQHHRLSSALLPSTTTMRPARSAARPARALDAALPFDSEARAAARAAKADRLSVGIVGFGTFGRFLAARLVQAGHSVSATSRTDYSREAAEIGVEFFTDADDFCERHPDVVVLATSILSAGENERRRERERIRGGRSYCLLFFFLFEVEGRGSLSS